VTDVTAARGVTPITRVDGRGTPPGSAAEGRGSVDDRAWRDTVMQAQ